MNIYVHYIQNGIKAESRETHLNTMQKHGI